ncbi:uncharacterized protein CcaverHIS019_0102690 [Cutaneotrichosporon cavernicola]|uniref:Formamidopyrimidine-DNA glycosylase catalytic domain-containing protein n=1 Tax=Cutaneotrichosporon cavernicola TaxID=279322 RepID=A0AA48HXZ1_9TREE|nr:uncharacterized protein CcaverHIS019_0102690 [Cutaneotrichosporon cavernicola]BEI87551.1 hypothetical protein CcaverHIS019_0102690 [Cutaneotrichosporon cavernicola]
MPELPEVEEARKMIADAVTGYTITEVDTVEDNLVYDGVTPHQFSKELVGRMVTGCERKGKLFWMTLDGKGRFPVMHFGMTGMIQFRGHRPMSYRRKYDLGDTWPPKFHRCVMKFKSPKGDDVQELTFIDPRRLGRLRLVPDPVPSHPPVSELGYDPVQNQPTLEEFKKLLKPKHGVVKSVLMDQSFCAGVGNWIVDEVLYQARVHPQCRVPELNDVQVADIHRLLREICVKALDVDGDWKRFPTNWLFFYRWDRGKKKTYKKKETHDHSHSPSPEGHDHTADDGPKIPEHLILPNGKPATVAWVTVGGRSSAYVPAVQKMPSHGSKKRKDEDDGCDFTDASYEEKPNHKKAKAAQGKQAKALTSASEGKEDVKPTKNTNEEDAKPHYNLRAERAARRASRK